MRKTKIVCTLGPATDDPAVLTQLILGGMNVARLNFSHGSHEEHKKRVDMVKRVRAELDIPVGIMLDTKGPEIRLREFENGSAELHAGDTFTLTTRDIKGNNSIVSITYEDLPRDLRAGDIVLIDDGLLELEVQRIEGTEIHCRVNNSGRLSNKKSVNIPDKKINMPYMNDLDRANLLFAIENDFDFIAASFVRNAACVKEVRRILQEHGSKDILIVSKIENREGVDNIDEIIRVSDGVMVARGDMGVEIHFEELPALQKKLIKKSYQSGKIVITATQMLDSMIKNPRPTRAEITDVANAVYDGTSAVMLSGETSIGKYPIETLKTMAKIVEQTESTIDYETFGRSGQPATARKSITDAIGHATYTAAHSLGASAIICVTKSGRTARMTSKYRPACPIIAVTTSRKSRHQLALSWGVTPVLAEKKNTTDEIFRQAIDMPLQKGLIKNGDIVVVTGGILVDVSGTTNTLKIHVVGNVILKGRGVNSLSARGSLYVVQSSEDDLSYFNAGEILVIRESTDKILPHIKHAAAIITEESLEESKAAVVGQALEIPVITDAADATSILRSGAVVRVDSLKGHVTT
jgi:pyruvate kinase